MVLSSVLLRSTIDIYLLPMTQTFLMSCLGELKQKTSRAFRNRVAYENLYKDGKYHLRKQNLSPTMLKMFGVNGEPFRRMLY